MFDNACHFNEPNSQLYKDALTLLRCMIKKKAELMPVVDHVVPNVQVLVQKLLKTLYNNVMNHKVSDDVILTAQKMKFSIMDFFSKCDQIRSFLWIWSHFLKKSTMENFIFCSVVCFEGSVGVYIYERSE